MYERLRSLKHTLRGLSNFLLMYLRVVTPWFILVEVLPKSCEVKTFADDCAWKRANIIKAYLSLPHVPSQCDRILELLAPFWADVLWEHFQRAPPVHAFWIACCN